MSSIVRRAENYKAFRIGPDSASYYACILDPNEMQGDTHLTAMVEIYPHGGAARSGPARHAEELLFVLKGKGKALCDGETRLVEPGDTIVVPAGRQRVIENIGPGKLYALTVIAPQEPLSAMMHNRTEVSLDDEDLGVLRRLPLRR
jgi:mannose-6-phosphate isomerase-like protein (cupin superfamily)